MSADYEISKHYNDTVTIKFYPDSHRYKMDGRRDYLIGVTSVTKQLDKSRALMIWAGRLTKEYILNAVKSGEPVSEALLDEAINQHSVKLDEAASSGSLVHAWAEAYIKGDKPDVPKDAQVRNGVMAFLRWIRENEVKFIASEKRVFSKKYGYVGTMDCIFTMGRESHKIIHPGDFKTSSGFYFEQPLQVAGYQEAESEEHGTVYGDKFIIRFDKNTGLFEVKRFDAEEHAGHFAAFLGLLEVKKQQKAWDKKHGYYSKK